MRIHIVQKGDTLWKIAQKYGVDFEQLKSMNSHLSNPDMIMPGMKIKVPTKSGSVKKEMPMAEQPFAQKETPVMPVEQQPVKEQPKETKKEVPKPVKKEVPKPIYMPKPPQPIIPEIDINNYYLLNMQKMNIEQPQPAPQPVQPILEVPELPEIPKEEPIKEEPVKEEPVAPVQPQMYVQPMPCQPCYPITPVLPGSGLPCMPIPCYPIGYAHGWGGHQPFMGGVYPQMMQTQMGQEMATYDPSMMYQQTPTNEGMYSSNTGDQSMWQQPQNQMNVQPMYDDYDNNDYNNDDQNDYDTAQLPMSQIQGAYNMNDMNPGGMPQWGLQPMYPTMMPHYPMQQPMYPMTQQSDCGCGSHQLVGTYGPETTSQPSHLQFPTGGFVTPDMMGGMPMQQQGDGLMYSNQMPQTMYGTTPYFGPMSNGQVQGMDINYPFNQYRPEDDYDEDGE